MSIRSTFPDFITTIIIAIRCCRNKAGGAICAPWQYYIYCRKSLLYQTPQVIIIKTGRFILWIGFIDFAAEAVITESPGLVKCCPSMANILDIGFNQAIVPVIILNYYRFARFVNDSYIVCGGIVIQLYFGIIRIVYFNYISQGIILIVRCKGFVTTAAVWFYDLIQTPKAIITIDCFCC